MRGSIVLGNPPSSLLSLLPHTRQKIPGTTRGKKHPAAVFRATPSCPGLPPSSPEQPDNLDDSQPLTAPVCVRTSPPSVQQCLKPPATAFPHPQRFTAEPRRKHPSSPRRFTSAHLLRRPSVRGGLRLAETGGTSTARRRPSFKRPFSHFVSASAMSFIHKKRLK